MSNAKYNKEYNENNYSPQKVYIQKDEQSSITHQNEREAILKNFKEDTPNE